MTIYEKAVQQMDNSDIDHHESDLYLKVTPTSEKLVSEHEFKSNVSVFTSQIDGQRWYDIPFNYDPFWRNKKGRTR